MANALIVPRGVRRVEAQRRATVDEREETPMRRHRTGPTDEHYPHAMIDDSRVSLGGLGLLLNLLAREDVPSFNDLVAEGEKRGQGEGRVELTEWVRELEDAGYIVRGPNTTDDDPVATDVYDTSQK
ncbi:hypothetical protein [Marinactinospora rubrisoli]|uniref:Uncharacterized protein n=1 Tax=Marinactinospora rubrisoli TaxID=2715399 RepID=A0ABW2KFW7_9ACTN